MLRTVRLGWSSSQPDCLYIAPHSCALPMNFVTSFCTTLQPGKMLNPAQQRSHGGCADNLPAEKRPLPYPSSPGSSLGGVGVSSAEVGDDPLRCHCPEEKQCRLFSINPIFQYVSSSGTSPVSSCLPDVEVMCNGLCERCWGCSEKLVLHLLPSIPLILRPT